MKLRLINNDGMRVLRAFIDQYHLASHKLDRAALLFMAQDIESRVDEYGFGFFTVAAHWARDEREHKLMLEPQHFDTFALEDA